MSGDTTIYGHSRGYRLLAGFALVAFFISVTLILNRPGFSIVAALGCVGFGILSWHAVSRSSRRIDVLHITDDGFGITDPAQMLGVIRYEEIEELRIYALHAHPRIGFRLYEPNRIRRRGPAILRVFVKPLWSIRQYQVIVEIDGLNDQVAAIKSVAVRTGIPIRSELL